MEMLGFIRIDIFGRAQRRDCRRLSVDDFLGTTGLFSLFVNAVKICLVLSISKPHRKDITLSDRPEICIREL
jgi:hypothetical protein